VRAEVGADAGRNAALQTLSVNGPLVAGGEPRLELIGNRCLGPTLRQPALIMPFAPFR